MKTNRLIITAVLIIAGSFFMNLSAQEALKTVMEKIENMAGVKQIGFAKSVQKYKQKTIITSISFPVNEELEKEILAAFEKDKDQADRRVENKDGRKIIDLRYSFGKISYSYSSKKNKNGWVSFTVMED
ncbi:MAG: DUF5024 domain-containing protein [Tannerella sp.]|jgi:hypothetical protein|nr:DUF5024 domain-containing protein [Tannerella sp.]